MRTRSAFPGLGIRVAMTSIGLDIVGVNRCDRGRGERKGTDGIDSKQEGKVISMYGFTVCSVVLLLRPGLGYVDAFC